MGDTNPIKFENVAAMQSFVHLQKMINENKEKIENILNTLRTSVTGQHLHEHHWYDDGKDPYIQRCGVLNCFAIQTKPNNHIWFKDPRDEHDLWRCKKCGVLHPAKYVEPVIPPCKPEEKPKPPQDSKCWECKSNPYVYGDKDNFEPVDEESLVCRVCGIDPIGDEHIDVGFKLCTYCFNKVIDGYRSSIYDSPRQTGKNRLSYEEYVDFLNKHGSLMTISPKEWDDKVEEVKKWKSEIIALNKYGNEQEHKLKNEISKLKEIVDELTERYES